MRKGTIKFFNEAKGYGFITDHENKTDWFVHVTELDGQEIKEGDEVSFETRATRRGLNAVNVQLIWSCCSNMLLEEGV